MELVFIGTGGGRVNLIKQFRGTGGFRINGSLNFHIDPGPGALVHSVRLEQDPAKIDVLVISHYHIDHCSDSAVLCEAMTNYGFKKQGILIGSRNSIEGDEKGDKALSAYHLELPAKKIVTLPGKAIEEEYKGVKFKMEFFQMKHDEKTSFGFKLHMDGKVVGYISDTEYFEGLGKDFEGCDVLVVNNLKPMHDGIPDHLASEDTIKILKVAKPKLCVLNHLGMKFFRMPAEVDAQKISEESGVKTIAPKDGMIIEVGEGIKAKTKEKKDVNPKSLSDFYE